MKEKIKDLILLQDCDNKIKKVDTRKKKAPLEILELERVFNERGMILEENNKKLESLKKDIRILEQGVQDLEDKMEKSRIKLNNIKSNKEYAAVLKEMEDLEIEKGQNEENILQIMEEIESVEKKILENNDEIAELKNEFDRSKEEIEREIKALDNELIVLEKQRAEFCEAMDKDLLKRYLFLKERKSGIAIGAVIEGVCQSCHMGIPPQQFNELIRCDSLPTCPNCNRLIYWGEEEYFIMPNNP